MLSSAMIENRVPVSESVSGGVLLRRAIIPSSLSIALRHYSSSHSRRSPSWNPSFRPQQQYSWVVIVDNSKEGLETNIPSELQANAGIHSGLMTSRKSRNLTLADVIKVNSYW